MINVISLKSSSRRKKFSDNNFEIFDAIEEDIHCSFDKKIFRLIYGRDARKGEIGCALSHFYLAKKHKDINDEWLLVLEDDAMFDEALLHFKNSCSSIEEPTILVLGHSKTKAKNLFVQRLIQPLYNKVRINENEFGEGDINYCGTVAYMINKSASHLLASNSMIFWLADDWKIIKNMGIKVLHIKSPLVYEDFDGVSTTGNKIVVEHDIVSRPLEVLYLILKNQIKKYLGR